MRKSLLAFAAGISAAFAAPAAAQSDAESVRALDRAFADFYASNAYAVGTGQLRFKQHAQPSAADECLTAAGVERSADIYARGAALQGCGLIRSRDTAAQTQADIDQIVVTEPLVTSDGYKITPDDFMAVLDARSYGEEPTGESIKAYAREREALGRRSRPRLDYDPSVFAPRDPHNANAPIIQAPSGEYRRELPLGGIMLGGDRPFTLEDLANMRLTPANGALSLVAARFQEIASASLLTDCVRSELGNAGFHVSGIFAVDVERNGGLTNYAAAISGANRLCDYRRQAMRP